MATRTAPGGLAGPPARGSAPLGRRATPRSRARGLADADSRVILRRRRQADDSGGCRDCYADAPKVERH
jgi:hypothetical protein